MEIAAPSSIVRSTDLSEVVVGEALRALSQLGVIYQTGDAYRLSLYWYQDVRRLLGHGARLRCPASGHSRPFNPHAIAAIVRAGTGTCVAA